MNSSDVRTSQDVYLDFCRVHDRCTPHLHGGCVECATPIDLAPARWRQEQHEREMQAQAVALRNRALQEESRKRRHAVNVSALNWLVVLAVVAGSAAIAWLARGI